MIVHNEMFDYNILGITVSLFANETTHGHQVCAEVEEKYYYLGDTLPNLESAINCWQDINDRLLSQAEINEVVETNELKF